MKTVNELKEQLDKAIEMGKGNDYVFQYNSETGRFSEFKYYAIISLTNTQVTEIEREKEIKSFKNEMKDLKCKIEYKCI